MCALLHWQPSIKLDRQMSCVTALVQQLFMQHCRHTAWPHHQDALADLRQHGYTCQQLKLSLAIVDEPTDQA